MTKKAHRTFNIYQWLLIDKWCIDSMINDSGHSNCWSIWKGHLIQTSISIFCQWNCSVRRPEVAIDSQQQQSRTQCHLTNDNDDDDGDDNNDDNDDDDGNKHKTIATVTLHCVILKVCFQIWQHLNQPIFHFRNHPLIHCFICVWSLIFHLSFC